jgi:hypothetical protein
MAGRPVTPAIDRIFSRLVPVGTCLEYNGARSHGYGSIRVVVGAGVYRSLQVHKLIYETHFGPVPEGLVVRHTCDNPPCCNPEHLLIGTHKDNTNDMIERGRYRGRPRQEECLRGHPFDEENTYISIRRSGHEHRQCRACQRIRKAVQTQNGAA